SAILFFAHLLLLPRSTLFPYTTLFRSIRCRSFELLPLLLFLTRTGADQVDDRPRSSQYAKQYFTYSRVGQSGQAVQVAQVQSPRSEEHTSELQSPDHLVCRLLLEKKKN